ncbi:hypothetical protein ACJX0J_018063, partial [Zea mays]
TTFHMFCLHFHPHILFFSLATPVKFFLRSKSLWQKLNIMLTSLLNQNFWINIDTAASMHIFEASGKIIKRTSISIKIYLSIYMYIYIPFALKETLFGFFFLKS